MSSFYGTECRDVHAEEETTTFLCNSQTLKRVTPTIATIRSSVLGPIICTLDEQRKGTDTLLAEYGLSRSLLDDLYTIIPLNRYIAFFETAAVVTKDRGLGLRLGGVIRPADLGPIGLLFSAASTLRAAFTHLSDSVSALQRATYVGLKTHDDFTTWTYQIEDPTLWPRVQDAEFSMASTCQLARSFAGPSWRPIEVHFEHDEATDCQALYRAFQAPIRFKQPANRLFLDNANIDRAVQKEDAGLTLILKRHIKDLMAEQSGDANLIQRVERLIGLHLGQGSLSVKGLAADLGLSPRTLQRRLGEEGTSVRALIRSHRSALAKLRIGSTRSSQAEIAHNLGYSDGTTFWRAFKSWTGATPTEFRKQSKERK